MITHLKEQFDIESLIGTLKVCIRDTVTSYDQWDEPKNLNVKLKKAIELETMTHPTTQEVLGYVKSNKSLNFDFQNFQKEVWGELEGYYKTFITKYPTGRLVYFYVDLAQQAGEPYYHIDNTLELCKEISRLKNIIQTKGTVEQSEEDSQAKNLNKTLPDIHCKEIDRLRDIRECKKIKQKDVAKHIGCSNSKISQLENYKWLTDLDTIFKYRDYILNYPESEC